MSVLRSKVVRRSKAVGRNEKQLDRLIVFLNHLCVLPTQLSEQLLLSHPGGTLSFSIRYAEKLTYTYVQTEAKPNGRRSQSSTYMHTCLCVLRSSQREVVC